MKMFISATQYNEIYSDSTGILISKHISEDINYLTEKNKKLQAENTKLRECVKFYAEPWERGELDGELLVRKLESYDPFTEVHHKAMQCLKELDENL